MSVALSITVDADIAARLATLPAALRARLAPVFADVAATLYARVIEKLDGEVVQRRTGRLQSSIFSSSDDRSASVGVDTDLAPYGAALEFGATIPAQLIAAKNAKALAFLVGGRQVFAKHVNRPAFVLPPHSFLRTALTELAPDLLAEIEGAVAEVVTP